MKLNEVIQNIDVWSNWVEAYKKYVPKFIEEAKNKKSWQDWNKDVFFEFFEQGRNQCVSSLQQGYFTNDEKRQIKDNWHEIAPLLKKIANSQDQPLFETYEEIERTIKNYTTKHRRSSTYRLIAGLQPNLLSTIVNKNNLGELFYYLKKEVDEISPEPTGNWYIDSFNIAQYYKQHINIDNPMDLISYPWQTMVYFKDGNKITSNEMSETEVKSGTDFKNSNSVNQILYGPPGTGKTFKLQQIIKDWELNKFLEGNKDYTSFSKNYRWWEVIALVLNEKENITVPEIATHPLIIAKLGSSNVKFLNTRLWTCLQNHTVDNCANVKLAKRVGEKVFFKEPNSLWRLDNKNLFEEIYSHLIDEYQSFKTQDQTKVKEYTFTTCHQSLSYEDFIEGIKPVIKEENEENENNISYEIRKGVFYNACEKAVQRAGFINLKDCLDRTKEERKKTFEQALSENKIHIVFLDEINRCNVSSVFGELITLIEDDKRLGNENEIKDIILPYSQDEFGVPANLFIIGTMNTADRSVEALDAALRRRFCFEEMPPLYHLEGLQNEIFGHKAFEILEKINLRIEKLLDKDHKIGHSYLLNKDEDSSIDSFYNNIIPLLQEYFFGDYSKIGLVLGKGFVYLKESNKALNIFAKFDDPENDFEDRNVYEIIDYRNELDKKLKFGQAIQDLMNK